MGQVTVQQLAEVVGASSERLLTQMKEAGLPHSEAEEAVSDEDKQTLLNYLKRSHGEVCGYAQAHYIETQDSQHIAYIRSRRAERPSMSKCVKKRTYVKRDAERIG